MKQILSAAFFFVFTAVSFSQGVPGACGYPKNQYSVTPNNGSGTLGMTFNQSACGLNYASDFQLTETRSQAAGFNTNGTGLPTTLTMSGIPNCPTIVRAYVWYTVSYQSGPPATSVVINSATVPATNIGQHGQKCWGELGTVVYRADVTANITAPGNGNYTIDITGLGNKNWEVDGVTMIVIYRDNGATYQGSLVLWDGANTCSNGGCTLTQTMTGINACAAGTNARAFLVVSDMQTASITPPQHNSTLNGATASYPNDFYNFDQVNTTVTNGQANANFGTAANNGLDCFCWALMGLYYQTTTCVTCTPAAVTVTVTTTPAMCGQPNGTATASASGAPTPYTYSWSTGASTSAISNLAAGSYTVTVTDATGCSTLQTLSITPSGNLAATITSTTVACTGGSTGDATATPTAGTAPYTYAWSTTPPQTTPTATGLLAGTYSVVISDANGCTATYTVAITIPNAITSTVTVLNNVSCFGLSDGGANVNASGGTPPYAYAWTPSGQITPIASGLAAGTYTATVTDANGCTIAQPVTITEPPAMSLPVTSSMASCGAADGTATVTPSGGSAPYTYLWLTAPAVQTTPTASNLAAGTYSVIVTDANGCFQGQSIVVAGGSPPVANFYLSPEIVTLEDPKIFFTDASGGAVGTWHWNFGDPASGTDDSSSTQNPFHIYSDTGVFCATLIIFDPSNLCSDTTVKCLKVEPVSTFYIPNTFTPNLDGKNEIFYGYGTYIKDFQMWVFDRWGNLIFESNDLYKGWDGRVKSKGDVVQEDVYVWKVRLTNTIGHESTYVGHVTVVK